MRTIHFLYFEVQNVLCTGTVQSGLNQKDIHNAFGIQAWRWHRS